MSIETLITKKKVLSKPYKNPLLSLGKQTPTIIAISRVFSNDFQNVSWYRF